MKKSIILIILVSILLNLLPVKAYADGGPEILSEAAILMDMNTGDILYQKNADEKLPPASTTKILTAMIVIEKCKLDDVVTVGKIPPYEDGSKIALNVGEELTVKDLLYAMMLESANDAASALAEYVSGSKENFSKLMNEKAQSLGCKASNFVNPNGLYDDNHYTTAKDLAIITKKAMENEVFRKVVSTITYEIPPTNKQPKPRKLYNRNKLLSYPGYKYDGATGVKNGYTEKSKNSLVASASRSGMDLISVVLKAEHSAVYKDSKALLDYGFNNFQCEKVLSKDTSVCNLNVGNINIPIYPTKDFYVTSPKNDKSVVYKKLVFENDIKKINKDMNIGYVEITTKYGGKEIIPLTPQKEYSSVLYTLKYMGHSTYKKVLNPIIKALIIIAVSFLILAITLLILSYYKRYRKRKQA